MVILEASTKPPVVPRKPKARRLFNGIAGSPLSTITPGQEADEFAQLEVAAKAHRNQKAEISKWDKRVRVKSDFTLRTPKSADREDPVPQDFDTWFDRFGQRHGAIDIDARFQECAFDPHLGTGAAPDDSSGHAQGINPDKVAESSLIQDFGHKEAKRPGFSTGLLPGEREFKRRRPTVKTYWIFDASSLREFIKARWNQDDPEQAQKAAWTLVQYYFKGRSDEEIAEGEPYIRQQLIADEEGTKLYTYDDYTGAWFSDGVDVKRYRQYLVKEGVKMFGACTDLKELNLTRGRGSWRGKPCNTPGCTQCQSNEQGWNYISR